MKRNKKILKRKEKGITLIALVITIIVLLIFAGVSIAMLTGENGILTQAQNAKESTDKATEEEKVNMAVLGSSIADNGYSEILDEASFRQELTNQFGNNGYDLVVNGDGSFIITVKESQRKYYVNDDKTVINSDNIIEISSAEELMAFRDDVNGGNSYEGKAVLLTSDITLSGEWEAIGFISQETDNKNPDTETNKPFRGIFDGCNHTIDNLTITSTENKNNGLFSFLIDASIRNVTIGENSEITGSTGAGVVGYLYGFKGNIYNCVNYANTNGAGIVLSIAGQHTISNCKNYGNIVSQKTAGGIIGTSNGTDWPEEFDNYSHRIINCANYGSITTNNNNCGGIVGYFKGDISSSFNKGKVSANGNNPIGGIAGNIKGIITSSYNTQDITGQECVGGILGVISDYTVKIIDCYSIGNVVGNSRVGEIVGYATINVTENCYTKDDSFTAADLGDAFKEDTENKNNGYPLLYWE